MHARYGLQAGYWHAAQKERSLTVVWLQVTLAYTAPTAIRALQSFGNEYVTKHSRQSLRILGTVGEPINPEAWKWYHEVGLRLTAHIQGLHARNWAVSCLSFQQACTLLWLTDGQLVCGGT